LALKLKEPTEEYAVEVNVPDTSLLPLHFNEPLAEKSQNAAGKAPS
jgi:hypothetical protein